jgi:seryl-tRNA synthetase
MIDEAVVDFIREFSQDPKLLKAVIEASAEATRVGVQELEKDRTKLAKDLSKLEKDSMTLVDRLADPLLSGITAIKNRLTELESEQQKLKSKITDLTLQIRDRRDLDISTEEVQAAYKDFAGIWDELEFDEQQYAIRLLIKEITLTFKKKEKEAK